MSASPSNPTTAHAPCFATTHWSEVLAAKQGDASEPAAELAPHSLMAVGSDTGVTISWPTNSVGVVLEFSESLSPPNWKTETSVQSVNADHVNITVPATEQNRFYRLRGL